MVSRNRKLQTIRFAVAQVHTARYLRKGGLAYSADGSERVSAGKRASLHEQYRG